MEGRQLEQPLTEKNIRFIIMIGLVINACSIIASVDYLFNNGKYVELTIATSLFVIIVLMIRRLNQSGK